MWISVVKVAALAALLVACDSSSDGPTGGPSPTGDPELWRTDLSEPYPHTTPVPPLSQTPVDGVYVRDYVQGTPPIPCRRCAPYRLNSGAAILTLDRGRFTIDHPAWEFESRGHFLIDGDRLILFNDGVCQTTRGVYSWEIKVGELVLEEIEDDCAFDLLRARYLSAAPWPPAP